MKARFIKEIGTRTYLRRYWDGCTNGSIHNAMKFVSDSPELITDKEKESVDSFTEWPTVCDHCGAIAEESVIKQVFRDRLYNTESGSPEPGDLYYVGWYPETMYFDNHKGPMLMGVCPDGSEWNLDSRASNCGSPEDKVHRCWVKHGSPEDGTIHVDKNGLTCNAGAGSIQTRSWHGYLHSGEWHI